VEILIMKYGQCAKCGLTLPINYLESIVANVNGQMKQVLICKGCKTYLENRDKQNRELK